MIATTFFFYLFSLFAIASAMLVITMKNPVHSVLFLILCFFNAAGLFVLTGAVFLAMILVVVYVGAVAVLFLFVPVVMWQQRLTLSRIRAHSAWYFIRNMSSSSKRQASSCWWP